MPDIGSASARGDNLPPRTVSSGLSLWLELEDPRRMGDLLAYLAINAEPIRQALRSLRYVHFSRFLPTPGWDLKVPPAVAALQVITEFDGDFDAYVLDFAMVIGDQFDHILDYVKDRPPSPVKDHPAAFLKFIQDHNVGNSSSIKLPVKINSAYADRTVIDIIGNGGLLARSDEPPLTAVVVDRADVQANVLHGLHMAHAMHLGVKFSRPDGARALLAGLLSDLGDLPRVSSGAVWANGKRPPYALTVGLTFKGLQALGLSRADTQALELSFKAFVRGPDDPEAAHLNGDEGASAPLNWRLGGPRKAVRMVLSIYANDPAELARQTAALRRGLATHGLTEVVACPADALAGPAGVESHDDVHFGFRDGLSQPRLAIQGEPAGAPDMQPLSGVGEFLLGSAYPNVYRGASSLGGLSPALAENATFCALRIMAQDVAAFEHLLDEASARHEVSREWLAAKLMGLWRNGTPVSQSPDAPLPEGSVAGRNVFDYAPSHAHPVTFDDAGGLRCPVGAHVRRMNPRSAVVAGKPYSRRLIRRGLPYGPAYRHGVDEALPERGLVGMFFCADLDRQFQFILRQWAQGDQAASGVRAEQDPIIGAQKALQDDHPMAARFRIPRSGGQADIVLDMPRLVTTVGSAYLLLPGLAGLAFLSQPLAQPAIAVARKPQAEQAAPAAALPPFDPTDYDDFRADPFSVYAAYRAAAPVMRFKFGDLDTVWVFDSANVAKVAGNPVRYHKQAVDQHSTAGLLNMDEPWHDACRSAIQPLFDQVLSTLRPAVTQEVAAQIQACRGMPQSVDWVANVADAVAQTLFFRLFGVDKRKAARLMRAVDLALARASPTENVSVAEVIKNVAGELIPFGLLAPTGSLFKLILGMGRQFDPDNDSLSQERFANATVMVLAGVLPAKWAMALAVWHLLDNGGAQLQVLRDNPDITDRAAAEELLRFDTPTPMSLRHATEDHDLGGVNVLRGDRVMVAWASASRDSARFGGNADSIDFTRGKGPGWAFGSGGAFECLGKELVLLSLSALIQALRANHPAPTLPAGFQPVWAGGPMFRAIHQLPVTWA